MRIPVTAGGGLRLAVAAAIGVHSIQAYVAGGSNPADILARFDVECELQLTVGRTPSTAMSSEWAASGAKLGLPLRVKFTPEMCDPSDSLLQDDNEALLGGALPSFLGVRPLNEPSFTSAKGQETVKVTAGRGACQMQQPETGQYSLRFFLEFPEGAARNDVVLPAERIYFMTACWNEDMDVIDKVVRWKDDAKHSMEQIDASLQKMDAPVGLLQKMSRFRRNLSLMERRRELAAQIDMLEEAFPSTNRLVKAPNNMAFLKEGVIAVKRFEGTREVFHWVGTFTFRNISHCNPANDAAV